MYLKIQGNGNGSAGGGIAKIKIYDPSGNLIPLTIDDVVLTNASIRTGATNYLSLFQEIGSVPPYNGRDIYYVVKLPENLQGFSKIQLANWGNASYAMKTISISTSRDLQSYEQIYQGAFAVGEQRDVLQGYKLSVVQRILVEHEGVYKALNSSSLVWEIVSSIYPTEEQFINQGIDAGPGKDISFVHQLKNAKILYYTNTDCTSVEKHDDVQAFSVYDYISEFPAVVAYSEIDEDIIITTTTEPFTIYDEFVDENGELGEIEILYYTDDPNTTGAELSITENWSPLDELEGDKELVVWTSEENAQRSLRVEGLLPEAFTHLDYWIDVENLVGMNIAATGEPAPFAIQKEGDPKYYSFYQGHFFELPVNERMFSNYGLRPTAVNTITQQQWKSFLGNVKKIRLLYMFSNQSIGTKSISTSLDVIHTVGTIKILREIRKTTPAVNQFQIEISKYSMQGRMEEIERINLNNLMALEMRTALLLNAAELKMHEMIIETFDDSDYEIPQTMQVEVEVPQEGVDEEGNPLPPIKERQTVPKPSDYNILTRQFEGDFILEVPMHVPDYASKLYVQGNGESYRMWIRDGVKSIEVIDVFNDTIDLTTFNGDQLYVRIEGAGGNMSAIAYAWQ